MPRYSCGHRVGHDSDRKNYNCKDCMHQDALAQEHAITEHYDEKIAVIEDWKDPMYGNRYTMHAERILDRDIEEYESLKRHEIRQVWDYYEAYWGPR